MLPTVSIANTSLVPKTAPSKADPLYAILKVLPLSSAPTA